MASAGGRHIRHDLDAEGLYLAGDHIAHPRLGDTEEPRLLRSPQVPTAMDQETTLHPNQLKPSAGRGINRRGSEFLL